MYMYMYMFAVRPGHPDQQVNLHCIFKVGESHLYNVVWSKNRGPLVDHLPGLSSWRVLTAGVHNCGEGRGYIRRGVY